MAISLTWGDLLPFAPSLTVDQADILIRGVMARVAVRVPCILDLTDEGKVNAARDILMEAVLRRAFGGGMVSSQRIGEIQVSIDRETAAKLLLDSDIAELQAICAGTVATVGPVYSMPAARDWPDPVERC